jgi:hypothetical protein
MTHSGVGRKERTDLELKNLNAVFRCNKFMQGVDRADKYVNYYSDPRETVKWPNGKPLMHFCVQNTKY